MTKRKMKCLPVDFRQLNKKIISDNLPLPRNEEIIDQLGRAKWFSVLDLKAIFHQIPFEKESGNSILTWMIVS